jgi:uncharacterized membrane protein
MNITADVAYGSALKFFGGAVLAGIVIAVIVIFSVLVITRIRKKKRESQDKAREE